MKAFKQATAYLREGKIYFNPSGRKEDDWLWIPIGPVLMEEESEPDTVLGSGILKAIEASQLDIPTPDGQQPEFLLEAAGISDWNEFGVGAKSVAFLTLESGIKFYPCKWDLSTNGYALLVPKAVVEESNDPEAIGTALRNAFDLCE